MERLYFDIHNVFCSYDRKKSDYRVALEIEDLQIPKGKIVFIVGQSGCGKSTILETLGLMNNTIKLGKGAHYLFHPNDTDTVDFTTIWTKSNDVLSKLRLDHFSFIFQQTNLMKSFNIFENIALTQLLQGASQNEAIQSTAMVLRAVGLDEFMICKDGGWSAKSKVFSMPTEASGGQRQRMAFARAIVAGFDVLFCDEPTGNLDPDTADKLMAFLYNEMRRKENATAIIVSHDLPLAMKYGDQIIKIFKVQGSNEHSEDFYGKITSSSLFVKNGTRWFQDGNSLSDDEVVSILKKANDDSI